MTDISVVVTFYNQEYTKLFQSLYSAIKQENVSFDIVITDDGSDNFDKEKIENWFYQHNFKDFTIISNKINQGTVINTMIGWEASTSKYVKMLSPGDFLYNSHVLHDLVEYMDNTGADLCFGKIAPYRINEYGKIEIISLNQPRDLEPYINYDKKQIQKNYLIKKDYPCGMSFSGKRELMLKYIKKIVGKAQFYEDCTYIIMVAAGLNIQFWNHEVIWYEVGSGISTSGSQIGNKRAFESNKTTYNIIRKEYPEWKEAYKPYINTPIKLLKNVLRKLYYFIIKRNDDTIKKIKILENHNYNLKELLNILNEEYSYNKP